MSCLTLYEYKKLLEDADYTLGRLKLKQLTDRLPPESLATAKRKILADLKDKLSVETSYSMLLDSDTCASADSESEDNESEDNHSEDEIYLDIYLGFSSIRVSLNDDLHPILIQESWYDDDVFNEDYEILIGDCSTQNIINIIKIFKTKGRGHSISNPSMSDLLKDTPQKYITMIE